MKAVVHGPFFGCYCDGGSARALPVNVEIDDELGSLVIEGDLVLSYWDLATVTVEELPRDELVRLTRLDSNEQLLLAGSAPVLRALAGTRWQGRPSGSWWWLVGSLFVLLVASLAVATSVPDLAAVIGPPLRPLVDVVWVDDDTMLGVESHREPELQNVLGALAERLGSPGTTFRVSSSMGINAYATTRGDIILPRGLLCHVEHPGELAGLVAHELAHLERGHPSASAVRSVLSMALTLALTDEVSYSVPWLALMLLNRWEARLEETVADGGAADRLNAARLSSEWLIGFFERHDEGVLGGTVLSDHPPLAERAAYFTRRGNELQREVVAPMSADEWEALRRRCERP